MKLYLNDASPYARLIRVLLLETELSGAVELAMVDPWQADDALLAANPAGKIPALELSDGTSLTESSCIAEFLIRHSGRDALSPFAHDDALQRLEVLGLGRVLTDCAFSAVIQRRFAPDSPLIDRWLSAVPRVVQRLDRLCAARPPDPACDLGDLTVAVALEYLDFRLGEIDWREGNRDLADQAAVVGHRASLSSTRPK